jgi:hypothetical protein
MRVRTPMVSQQAGGKKRDEPACRVAECIGLQHGIQLSGGMILRVVVLRDLLLRRPAGEEPRQALHGARAFYRCVVPGCRCDREAAPGARSANRPVRPGAGCGVISAGLFGVIPHTVSTTGASRSFPVTRTKREKWKCALISFSLIRLVDLGVPRSSRGGGTNKINGLRPFLRSPYGGNHSNVMTLQ